MTTHRLQEPGKGIFHQNLSQNAFKNGQRVSGWVQLHTGIAGT
jgi:hypothetical protein